MEFLTRDFIMLVLVQTHYFNLNFMGIYPEKFDQKQSTIYKDIQQLPNSCPFGTLFKEVAAFNKC